MAQKLLNLIMSLFIQPLFSGKFFNRAIFSFSFTMSRSFESVFQGVSGHQTVSKGVEAHNASLSAKGTKRVFFSLILYFFMFQNWSGYGAFNIPSKLCNAEVQSKVGQRCPVSQFTNTERLTGIFNPVKVILVPILLEPCRPPNIPRFIISMTIWESVNTVHGRGLRTHVPDKCNWIVNPLWVHSDTCIPHDVHAYRIEASGFYTPPSFVFGGITQTVLPKMVAGRDWFDGRDYCCIFSSVLAHGVYGLSSSERQPRLTAGACASSHKLTPAST